MAADDELVEQEGRLVTPPGQEAGLRLRLPLARIGHLHRLHHGRTFIRLVSRSVSNRPVALRSCVITCAKWQGLNILLSTRHFISFAR